MKLNKEKFSVPLRQFIKRQGGALYYFICVLCVCTTMILLMSAFNEKDAEMSSANNELTIVIDAGHGGEDGGAVAPDGTLEKDLNLCIAQKLNTLLQCAGYKTQMIRESDISINDSDASTTREIKVSDMHNRLAIYNSSEYNIVVGIHQNKFEQSKYNGTQIFYSKNNQDSNILAESVRNSVVSLLQPENTRELKPADSNIYLLHNAKVPAIITECGFISNQEELQKLKDDSYQQKMAFSIFCGILDYISN